MKPFWQLLIVFLSACTSSFQKSPCDQSAEMRKNFGSVLGDRQIVLKIKKDPKKIFINDKSCVNKFLWQGALETFAFMPITYANPLKGKIITDWHFEEELYEENKDKSEYKKNKNPIKVRIAIVISGTELRADAVKIFVDRQKLNSKKVWKDCPVSKKDCYNLEMLVVERARKLRNLFLNEK